MRHGPAPYSGADRGSGWKAPTSLRQALRTCFAGSLIAASLMAIPAAARPMRIVSLNPCADAILVHIADPAQIAAISHYSHDPRATSLPLKQALRFPVTSGTAEEVLAKRPDLVIAGPHVALPTIQALQRLNIHLMQINVPESVAESQAQITELAAALGVPRRGARLNARIEAALARARPADRAMIPALIWQGGGMVPGKGTLAEELLRRTGFRNMSGAYGLQQWDVLPLEHLLARPPRVLFTAGSAGSKGDRMLSHPALHRLSHRIAIRDYAPRLLHCAGPSIIAAAARLSEVRRSMAKSARPDA